MRVRLVVSVLLVLAAGCRRTEKSAGERAASLYIRTCASCHGPTGRPPAQLSLPARPRDLSEAGLYQRRSDDQLKAVIREGRGAMPAFGTVLGDEEIDLLIQHLHTLAQPK